MFKVLVFNGKEMAVPVEIEGGNDFDSIQKALHTAYNLSNVHMLVTVMAGDKLMAAWVEGQPTVSPSHWEWFQAIIRNGFGMSRYWENKS